MTPARAIRGMGRPERAARRLLMYALMAAFAVLWPAAEACAAKFLGIERPQENLSSGESAYLDDLEEELIEDFAQAGFQHIDKTTRLSDKVRPGEDNYLVKAKFSIHDRGIRIKLSVIKVEKDATSAALREDKIWSYPIVLGTRNQDMGDHVRQIHRELGGHFMPSVKFYMTNPNETRLLANCILADDAVGPAAAAVANHSKYATLHYYKKLAASALAAKYRIKGMERSEYRQICRRSDAEEHPQARAYDHVVHGFLTEIDDRPGIVLVWARNDGGVPSLIELTLGASDAKGVTNEISLAIQQLAP